MKQLEVLKSVDFKTAPKLNFLKRLTNQTGVIQHTKYAVPDRNLGYSVDDNARGLIVACLYYKLFGDEGVLDLALIYLSFVLHSKTADNWFYNFLTFDNKFVDQAKTEDGFGRVMWALGYAVFSNPRRDIKLGAANLIEDVKENISKLISPRAISYTLAGLYYLSKAKLENSTWEAEIKLLADKLVSLYKKNKTSDWHWFEPYMTYSNGIFPYSLALASEIASNDEYALIASESLEFLDKETTDKNGVPCPIGQDGWYKKDGKKALFDQQPVEAADMVIAYLALYKLENKPEYFKKAKKWFSWYYGNNIKQVEVYDNVTTGCFDGINPWGVNLNQGAESIITYLMAYLAFCDIELKNNS